MQAAKLDNQAWAASTDAASVFGRRIDLARWTDEAVWIRLMPIGVVTIQCSPNGVSCAVDPKGDLPVQLPKAADASADVELDFDGVLKVWNRDSLIAYFPGRKLSKIYMSGDMLFVYVSGLPIIRFATIQDRDTGKLFLYWHPSK